MGRSGGSEEASAACRSGIGKRLAERAVDDGADALADLLIYLVVLGTDRVRSEPWRRRRESPAAQPSIRWRPRYDLVPARGEVGRNDGL